MVKLQTFAKPNIHDALFPACLPPFDDCVPVFQSPELQLALQHLRQGKSAEPNCFDMEMISYAGYADAQLHQCLLGIYNKMLAKEEWHPTWHHTMFTMLPKPGDTSLVQNQLNGTVIYGLQVWIKKKVFDRIEHKALFTAPARQGVPQSYAQVLKQCICSVNGNRKFQILRRVKQGDILSPLLFNAGFEEVV